MEIVRKARAAKTFRATPCMCEDLSYKKDFTAFISHAQRSCRRHDSIPRRFPDVYLSLFLFIYKATFEENVQENAIVGIFPINLGASSRLVFSISHLL